MNKNGTGSPKTFESPAVWSQISLDFDDTNKELTGHHDFGSLSTEESDDWCSDLVGVTEGVWTTDELTLLQELCEEIPPGRLSPFERYVHIAARIPSRTVRDVALKTAALDNKPKFSAQHTSVEVPSTASLPKLHSPEASLFLPNPPINRSDPVHTQQPQPHSMHVTGPIPSPHLPSLQCHEATQHLHSQFLHPCPNSAPVPEFPQPSALHSQTSNSSGMSANVETTVGHVLETKVGDVVGTRVGTVVGTTLGAPPGSEPILNLLDHNYSILNQIRTNMSTLQVFGNIDLLVQYRDNINAMLSILSMPTNSSPPLPPMIAKPNLELANTFLPAVKSGGMAPMMLPPFSYPFPTLPPAVPQPTPNAPYAAPSPSGTPHTTTIPSSVPHIGLSSMAPPIPASFHMNPAGMSTQRPATSYAMPPVPQAAGHSGLPLAPQFPGRPPKPQQPHMQVHTPLLQPPLQQPSMMSAKSPSNTHAYPPGSHPLATSAFLSRPPATPAPTYHPLAATTMPTYHPPSTSAPTYHPPAATNMPTHHPLITHSYQPPVASFFLPHPPASTAGSSLHSAPFAPSFTPLATATPSHTHLRPTTTQPSYAPPTFSPVLTPNSTSPPSSTHTTASPLCVHNPTTSQTYTPTTASLIPASLATASYACPPATATIPPTSKTATTATTTTAKTASTTAPPMYSSAPRPAFHSSPTTAQATITDKRATLSSITATNTASIAPHMCPSTSTPTSHTSSIPTAGETSLSAKPTSSGSYTTTPPTCPLIPSLLKASNAPSPSGKRDVMVPAVPVKTNSTALSSLTLGVAPALASKAHSAVHSTTLTSVYNSQGAAPQHTQGNSS